MPASNDAHRGAPQEGTGHCPRLGRTGSRNSWDSGRLFWADVQMMRTDDHPSVWWGHIIWTAGVPRTGAEAVQQRGRQLARPMGQARTNVRRIPVPFCWVRRAFRVLRYCTSDDSTAAEQGRRARKKWRTPRSIELQYGRMSMSISVSDRAGRLRSALLRAHAQLIVQYRSTHQSFPWDLWPDFVGCTCSPCSAPKRILPSVSSVACTTECSSGRVESIIHDKRAWISMTSCFVLFGSSCAVSFNDGIDIEELIAA